MKGLFKSKPRTPAELVRYMRELLIFIDRGAQTREQKREKQREEKVSELNKCILEIRTILYGIDGAEPVLEACTQLTLEFLKEDTIRLLIVCLPKLDLGARQNATRVITNLSRQRVNSRLIAAEYLENNIDVINILIPGYEDSEIALSYGAILREYIRYQSVARYVLESAQMKKFFDYVQNPTFEIASDAAATFKELLTRHKSTVAEFLSKNFDWFFREYNSQLLQSPNYITRRHAVKLLGDMLLDRSNSAVMIRYVSSLDNMRILMNLLRESNKAIQLESFHVFKPPEIVSILVTNRSKLLRFFGDFNIDKEDDQFEADKAQVIREITNLNPRADDGVQ
ncbi:putative MO25-like protein At5g47540 isoform X2 [Vitis riparia]|uniref:putative MO25-like protein At5g47540 isoform X2 n=1 Tax=Vitis vinifera TaxID=29760 RepID=UPI00053F42AC|nr:putative MO25-like protein At5g47540 isoform X2 [Vitis vinifera]XP_034702547.1 putative MO25-like protein At5g47540 isoform X2 [Vitis riparia]|eukprot:XP_010657417.1 PREDICTED: putative MO25-like protein At5g47540 isoform X2 [Vitis vinifera]